MKQILDDPSGYERHLQRYAASVVVSVTYGKRINSVDEWVVKEQMDAVDCEFGTTSSSFYKKRLSSIR